MGADPKMVALQVQNIGRIALGWNNIEHDLNEMVANVLNVPPYMALAVSTRINGFDGKVALVRIRMEHMFNGVDHWGYKAIDSTLSYMASCKSARDNVVHTQAEWDTNIGSTTRSRGKIVKISISPDDLLAIYENMSHCGTETFALWQAISVHNLRNQRALSKAELEEDKLAREFGEHMTRLRELQKLRESLSNLPSILA